MNIYMKWLLKYGHNKIHLKSYIIFRHYNIVAVLLCGLLLQACQPNLELAVREEQESSTHPALSTAPSPAPSTTSMPNVQGDTSQGDRSSLAAMMTPQALLSQQAPLLDQTSQAPPKDLRESVIETHGMLASLRPGIEKLVRNWWGCYLEQVLKKWCAQLPLEIEEKIHHYLAQLRSDEKIDWGDSAYSEEIAALLNQALMVTKRSRKTPESTATLQEFIEEKCDLLQALGDQVADPQVVKPLLKNLEQLLNKEVIQPPQEGEKSVHSYLVQLYSNDKINWGNFRYRQKLTELLEWSYTSVETPQERRDRIADLRQSIEDRSATLLESYGDQEADLQVVKQLFKDLSQLLAVEKLNPPLADDKNTHAYITSVKASDIHWGNPSYHDQLTSLLEQSYAQTLQRLVVDASKNDYADKEDKMAIVLSQLASLHQVRGVETGKLSYHTDAAILHQHALQLWEMHDAVAKEQTAQTYQSLAHIRTNLLKSIQQTQVQDAVCKEYAPNLLQNEIVRDRKELTALRNKVQRKLTKIDAVNISEEAIYSQKSSALFAEISAGISQFLARLYRESEEELAKLGIKVPCEYAIVGLGSMALQQMTPYSDLEFAILLEDQEDKETLATHREYFRQLSHLVHFRVINLGETVLPMSKYGSRLDRFSKRGVNFDLGGKTPLGRSDKDYDLIQPVSEMMNYLRDDEGAISKIDMRLPSILERTCFIYGNQALYDQYNRTSVGFLREEKTEEGVPVCRHRAQQMLWQVKIRPDIYHLDLGNPNLRPSPDSLFQFQGDINKFDPQFDHEGLLYNVKQEIYRLPDRLLYGLALYYGILPTSVWDAVEKLHQKGIISAASVPHLQYAASFATLLRLRTYLHHGQQKDSMGMYHGEDPASEEISQHFTLPPAALEEQGSLFKYYYTALPLHSKMEAFFTWQPTSSVPISEEVSPFRSVDFYDANDFTKGLIYQRLMQPKKSIDHWDRYREALQVLHGDTPHSDVATCFNNLGVAYEAQGNLAKSLVYKKQALKMKKALPGDTPLPAVVDYLNNLGITYAKLGELEQGCAYVKQALEMYENHYGDTSHSKLALSLNNLGNIYVAQGDLKKGLLYQEKALKTNRDLYGDTAHPDIASSLNNLGGTYYLLGALQKARLSHEEALVMQKEDLYGPTPHPKVKSSLDNLGIIYRAQGDLKESLSYQEQALAMSKTLHGDQPHLDLAGSLNNLGITYNALGELQKGLLYQEQALEMRKALHADVPCTAVVAESLHNVGTAYVDMGTLRKGLKFQEQALALYGELYGSIPHQKTAASLHNLGTAYQKMGDLQKAYTYYEKSLRMRKALYEHTPHPQVIASLNNLGAVCQAKGELEEGLLYHEQALEMCRALHGDKPHPDVAQCLNNLGVAYAAQGNLTKDLAYQEQSLAMRKELHENKPHPAIAESLQNLGMAYYKMGERSKGLLYQIQALEMNKVLYHDIPHPDVASSLYNVGIVYEAQNNLEEARLHQEQALEMYKSIHGDASHPHVAASLKHLGAAYYKLGEVQKGLSCHEQALEMYKKLYGDGDTPRLDVAMSCYNLGEIYLELGDTYKSIDHYEEALKLLPVTNHDLQMRIKHNLGCMYHIAFLQMKDNQKDANTYLAKANHTFAEAVAACVTPRAGLLTEYANFLLRTGQYAKAYDFLIRTIDSKDYECVLGYSMAERTIVTPLLQEYITKNKRVVIRAIDYAYYLLLHHYEKFLQAGITPEKSREVYLMAYKQDIASRSGQSDDKNDDSLVQLLLNDLLIGHQTS